MTKQLTRFFVAAIALLLFLSVGVLVANSADNNGYRAHYYNNRNLQGNPVLTRYDNVIDFNWGEKSPAPGVVNKDDFSVRWQRTVKLTAGTYRFTVSTDDGVRVKVNGRQIINEWTDHPLRTFSADMYLPGGDTYIVVEYYDRVHLAIASFKYELIDAGTATPKPWNPTATPKPWNPTATPKPWNPTATPKPWNPTATPKPWNPTATPKPWNPTATPKPWNPTATATQVPAGSGPELAACTSQPVYTNYWNNKFLSGPPAVTRTEGNINYNWGKGSPAGNVQNDNFSARWSTTYNLLPGMYTFTTTADDGVRVYVDGKRLIDQWYNSAAKTGKATYYHQGGKVEVIVEYYEAAEYATIAFSCTRMSGETQPPTATPTPKPWNPTATPKPWNPTATPVPPTATPLPPTATPDPLLTANAGSCQISRVYTLNVRSGPGLAYAIVGTVEYGDIVIRTGGRSGSWVQIRTDEQKIGWIKEYYCGNGELPETESTATTCGSVAVAVDALYVRSGPSGDHTWLDVVYRGESLTLTCQCEGQWVSVMTAEGVRGWVYYPYTNITQAQLDALH